MNKNFICSLYNSNLTGPSSLYDENQCKIIKFAGILYYYNFGYICMGFIGVVIFISLFGRIKGTYRWFILNQAIFDLIASYNYSCNNAAKSYIPGPLTPLATKCFYMPEKFGQNDVPLQSAIGNYIKTAPYFALCLLAASRFFALFYMNIYDKLTKKRQLILIFFVVNLSIILLNLGFYIPNANQAYRTEYLLLEIQQNKTTRIEAQKDYLLNLYSKLTNIFICVLFFIPLFCLFFSVYSAAALIYRILKQAKFQRKHNQKEFFSSLRIACVILFQTTANAFVLFLEMLNFFELYFAFFLQIKLITSNTQISILDPSGYTIFKLPLWLDGPLGLASSLGPRQMIFQLRVFLDCIFILLIMTGYREAIFGFIKLISNSQKYYQKSLSFFNNQTTAIQGMYKNT